MGRTAARPAAAAPARAPFGVIMYGRFTRSAALTTAHSTIGQRAISSSTPRHVSPIPDGWNHRRLQRHISVAVRTTARLYARYSNSETFAIGRPVSSATTGSTHSTASDSDHSVYQPWAIRNWNACPGVYRRTRRGVCCRKICTIEYAHANCWPR